MTATDTTADSVSVIIPHLDDVGRLKACLHALESQTHQAQEIIVVDNGSPGGVQAVREVTEQSKLRPRVISEQEKGAGPARNAGVEIASGSIIAFLDCDCRPHVNWLEDGLAACKYHPIVGGEVQVVSHNDIQSVNAYEVWDMIFGFDAKKFLQRGGHLLTANLLVRRAVFREIGPFKKELPEDTEWCHRATAKGFPLVFDRNLIVEHPALSDWPQLKSRWLRLTREAFLYWQLKRRGRITWGLRTCLVLASIVPHSVKVLLAREAPGLTFKLRVFGVLVRVRTLRFLAGWRLLLF